LVGDLSRRLDEALAENARLIDQLQRDHERIVAASADSNADDEHDPEGATIAFEREQLTALLGRARHTQGELVAAQERLRLGTYGSCAGCDGSIAAARLQALPAVRTCIDCARART
jgi:DnaK suppressor protein